MEYEKIFTWCYDRSLDWNGCRHVYLATVGQRHEKENQEDRETGNEHCK